MELLFDRDTAIKVYKKFEQRDFVKFWRRQIFQERSAEVILHQLR